MAKTILVLLCALVPHFAQASIRPIVIPGKLAIINMQAASATGMDPDPRALYDQIAMAELDGPQGSKGKVISVPENDFVLSCAFQSVVSRLNVDCSVTVKPTARTQVGFGLVEAHITGAEARELYAKFAGPNATQPFLWDSSNGWLHFESTQDAFDFRYRQ